jgi:hypothetical protein
VQVAPFTAKEANVVWIFDVSTPGECAFEIKEVNLPRRRRVVVGSRTDHPAPSSKSTLSRMGVTGTCGIAAVVKSIA